MNDKEFLKLAIRQSELSIVQGRFPAGALVVLKNEIISSEVSEAYPDYQHVECKAVDVAFEKIGKLNDAVLYASMEPCVMCLMRAYWAGIRKIVYAISRRKVDRDYYEGLHNNLEVIESLNESLEYLQVAGLQEQALKTVVLWEKHKKSYGK